MTQLDPSPRFARRHRHKLAVLAALAVIVGTLYFCFRDRMSIDALARHEDELRAFHAEHPWQVYAAAFLIYTAYTAAALPFVLPLSMAYGWLFGFFPAVVLVSFASTTGALLSFLLSRYLLREWTQSTFKERLPAVEKALAQEGTYYLLAMRLNPIIPYFAINLLMGLTPMRAGTFWWASQVGMLPVTALLVYAGASLPHLSQIAEGGLPDAFTRRLFVVLIVVSVVLVRVRRRFAKRSAAKNEVAA